MTEPERNNGGLRFIVDVLGPEALCKLIEASPGIRVYIPKIQAGERTRDVIRENPDRSASDLARDLGISVQAVYWHRGQIQDGSEGTNPPPYP